jgi:outer membrane protein
MKTYKRNIALIVLIALFFEVNSSFSQQQITLNDAINLALKNNLDIQISKNNVSATSINNHIGVAGGLPTVTANASTNQQLTGLNQELSNGTTTNRNSVMSNNSAVGFVGTFLLFNGGRVLATKNRLEELQNLSQQQLNATIQNTIADVMLKYYAVVQQQNFITTLNQSIEVSKQKLSLIETRKSVGLSNDAELFQAQLDLNTQVQALQSQNILISQAKFDLLRSLVLQHNSEITVRDTIIVDRNVGWEAVEVNLKKNPNVLTSDIQIVINKIIEREVNARRFPLINANAGYNYNINQSTAGFTLLNQIYGPFIGLSVSMPIYTGTANVRQLQVAKINSENAQLQRESVIQNYKNSASKAWEAYISTIQLIDNEQKNYQIAQKLLNLITQRFQLGQGTIIDIREAQRSFENSGYRLNNLNYNAKVAEITLKQIANQLGN